MRVSRTAHPKVEQRGNTNQQDPLSHLRHTELPQYSIEYRYSDTFKNPREKKQKRVLLRFLPMHTHAQHSNDGQGPPPLESMHAEGGHMTFSYSCDTVLLFQWWKTNECSDYLFSLFIIFGACLLQEWITSRKQSTQGLSAQSSEHAPLFVNTHGTYRRGHKRFISTACFHAASVSLSFLIMLLVMSFNLGVFVTVITGLSCGHALFVEPRILRPEPHVGNSENTPAM